MGFAVLAAVLVAGCAPGVGPGTGGSGGGGPRAAEATIPDSFSPVVVTPISDPTFPWKGSDGRYHVAYDLQLTNASRLPATLTTVDVVDAGDPDTVIASITGSQLVDPDCPYGDCNRLRQLPSSDAPDTVLPPGGSRALLVDLVFDSRADVPRTVAHRLSLTGAAAPPASEPTPISYLAAPFDITSGGRRVVAPPLKGDNWVAFNGCCGTGWPHRPSLSTFSGRLDNSQRFAIDWIRLDEQGRVYDGDRTDNASYVSYGEDVYAVADGTVTSTLDTVEAGTPGTLPANDPVLAPKITIENVDGNNVIIDLGGGVWAMYAHLQQGSLLVEPGDHVRKGQKIAELGNTGNSNAPHLHFQLMNGPSILQADGLPYVIDGFTYDGQVLPEVVAAADDYLSGTFLGGALPQGRPATDELPLGLALIGFPE
jgi:murein DD-endopeptidase MepM/ murein hydrolase activator NlpD